MWRGHKHISRNIAAESDQPQLSKVAATVTDRRHHFDDGRFWNGGPKEQRIRSGRELSWKGRVGLNVSQKVNAAVWRKSFGRLIMRARESTNGKRAEYPRDDG
jgi:hypothetical protein